MRERAILIATAAIGAFAVLGAQGAAAATIEVTNTNDTGAGSLRAAINQANQLAGSDRIVIEATGTIPLQSGLPTVTGTPLVIRGPGASNLSLDGSSLTNTTHGVLELDPINQCWPSRRCQVILRGVSIDHAPDAIRNGGVLDLIHSRLSDNAYGILNGRRLTVIDSTLSDNHYGIVTFDSANRTGVLRSTLRGNGTGISTNNKPLNVTQSTLIGNHRYGIDIAFGGVVIDRSTLAGSRTTNAGGALTITQSTLSAKSDHAVISSSSNASTTLQSTIVANPSSGTACSGPVNSGGYNLVDDGSCDLTSPSEKPNTDPLLRPLGSYGGPTQTFALRKTSPAIDAGLAYDTPTDQRGLPRVVDYPGVPAAAGGNDADIGAFELQSP